jgi:hypothetical protein
MAILQADRDKLIKILKMTTSSQAGERDAAILLANQFLKDRKTTWEELLQRPPVMSQERSFARSNSSQSSEARPDDNTKESETSKTKKQAESKDRGIHKWNDFVDRFPAEAEWIDDNAATFDFAESLYNNIKIYGRLTVNQMAAVHRCMARDERKKNDEDFR